MELDGQRVDTGPSLFTFPGVWEALLTRLDALDTAKESAAATANLQLVRLPEVGRYHHRDDVTALPVPPSHPWHEAWTRFAAVHGGLGPQVTTLLTADPLDRRTLPSLVSLLSRYGTKLTTQSYLNGLAYLPEGLRDVIAIHTLNAGVAPARTAALYASMPAIMAADGVYVPDGGVYELVLALVRLCQHAGVTLRVNQRVTAVVKGAVRTADGETPADVVVSNVDDDRLRALLEPDEPIKPQAMSCSAIAIYAALSDDLPASVATHAVVLPDDPAALYQRLEAGDEPAQTMAFVNCYRPGEVYPNARTTLALLLTAPANGKAYTLDDPLVVREVERVSRRLGLDRPLTSYFGAHTILHPRTFAIGGASGGSLYGAVRPFWRSGPFHQPGYSDSARPWLWRVGASVHPGGGMPAVLAGALASTGRLLRRLGHAPR
jgi:phytoene desaturase